MHCDEKKAVEDYGLVSVIMPNYNGEEYLSETIKSVLAQTYQHWELLFVDDCSLDSSVELVNGFCDERIRVFSMKENSGAALARNKAIEEAQGRWIAFLDSDDVWLPEKLEKQIAYMHDNDILLSYTDYEVVENGRVVSIFKPRLDVCRYKDILKHNHIGCLTAVYDSGRLGKVLMPINALKREDMACWLHILRDGEKAYRLPECLAQYRVHSNSVSSNKLKMLKYQWRVYRKVEQLNVFNSLYYTICWAFWGVLKYR